MALRDGYSNFKFYDAITPVCEWSDSDLTGATIDTLGYETATFALCTGSDISASSASYFAIRMQHASASAAGDDGNWSWVSEGHVIGSDFSLYTTITSGIVFSIFVSTVASVASIQSAVFLVGYRGKRRYVRLVHSAIAGLSGADDNSAIMGAVAYLGLPANWPVNTVL